MAVLVAIAGAVVVGWFASRKDGSPVAAVSSSDPAIAHSLLETELIRRGEDGAYRLRVRVFAYPRDAAELRRVGEAVVAEFTDRTPACVLHVHVYGPGTNTNFMSDVGNLVWAPATGLGIADCRQSPRSPNTWKVEFLGARPTIASSLHFGTGLLGGIVPLPAGARRIRQLTNRNGMYGTYALAGATVDDVLSLYRVEMPKRGWEMTGVVSNPRNVAFMRRRALATVEWKADSIFVGYEPAGAPTP